MFKRSDANKLLMFTNDSIVEINLTPKQDRNKKHKKIFNEIDEKVLINFGNIMDDPPNYGTFSVD